MPGKDATELVVGAQGRVYVNDSIGVNSPTTSTSALGAGWMDMGYVTEDGVTFHDTIEKKRVPAWNARRPVALIAGNATTTCEFALLQWSTINWRFAFGGGNVGPASSQTVYTPNADADDYRAMIIQWQYGTKHYRLFFPRGIVSGDEEIVLTQTDETPLPISFEAMPLESAAGVVTPPWYLYTDDSNFTQGST